jgi:hypothetical protein
LSADSLPNSSSSRRNYILQLLTVFAGYLIFGFSDNIKGPAIPRIQSDLRLDEMQLGAGKRARKDNKEADPQAMKCLHGSAPCFCVGST